jgi:GNAT superfamily N-acetyltransferase
MDNAHNPLTAGAENSSITFTDLVHDNAFGQIFTKDLFAFKDQDALFRHLHQQEYMDAAGFFFQAAASRGAAPDVFSCMVRLSRWLAEKPASMVFGITAGLGPSQKPVGKNQLAGWQEKGLKLIHWQCAPELAKIPDQLLWQVSRQGIWNHVTVPASLANSPAGPAVKCIMDNPHLVHSYDIPENDVPVYSAYDMAAPLPGRPVWELLGTSERLLACLSRFPVDHLIRLRYHGTDLLTLGQDIAYHFTPPADLPKGYLDAVCAMVAAGGSVELAHVRSNLEKAYLIGYAVENGVMVGNSCLKHPRKALIDRLKIATDLDFSGFVERGYTSVRPEYRSLGVGRKLLEGLTARAGKYKVFSLIAEDNLATQKIALRNNTKKITTYFSEKANKQMGVWMPEQMISTLENNADDAVNQKDNPP